MGTSTSYLALLRGINVGGNNIIKMADLKTCFETMGFTNVSTYIQSGNVIFTSEEVDQIKLEAQIEKVLSETFNYSSKVVVVSHQQLKAVVENTPDGFGLYPETHKYDVVFLKKPLTAESAIAEVVARKEVDSVFAINGVLYFSRTIANLTKSYLIKIITLPIYKFMTIRNWNTTSKLITMMERYNSTATCL
jgi:uncharacterized protein (DUF1697 family)